LGRKGYVTGFLRKIKKLQPSERKTFGSQANQLKVFLTERLMAAASKLIEQEIMVLGENDRIDVTRPGRLGNAGS
jgi:phenylalanyl-tRNA synthetase alpha chain